jgi:hypothetical protein
MGGPKRSTTQLGKGNPTPRDVKAELKKTLGKLSRVFFTSGPYETERQVFDDQIRRTPEAQANPAPKEAIPTRSPALRTPPFRASSRAMGMEAAEVFP